MINDDSIPPGPQLPSQPWGLLPVSLLGEQRTEMGVNSLRKTVTRQRRDCDLNPGPSAPESSTLTTRLIVTYVSGVEWYRPTFLSGAHRGVTVYSYISARLYIAAVRSNLQYQLWWLMNDDADCCVHYIDLPVASGTFAPRQTSPPRA